MAARGELGSQVGPTRHPSMWVDKRTGGASGPVSGLEDQTALVAEASR
jgi:hypothetical protein